MTFTLVLIRHGQSQYNLERRFTGWTDVDLTAGGIKDAQMAGRLLQQAGISFDVAFTSLLKRAIKTLWLMLEEMDLMWIPVYKAWQLNERHYGQLQDNTKSDVVAQYGDEQVQLWRRGYREIPPRLSHDDRRHPRFDRRYGFIPSEKLPVGESLMDTNARLEPYLKDTICPAILSDQKVLIASHGNTMRALIKIIEGISEEDITALNVPTGIPIIYKLNDDMQPINKRYLGDFNVVQKAIRIAADKN